MASGSVSPELQAAQAALEAALSAGHIPRELASRTFRALHGCRDGASARAAVGALPLPPALAAQVLAPFGVAPTASGFAPPPSSSSAAALARAAASPPPASSGSGLRSSLADSGRVGLPREQDHAGRRIGAFTVTRELGRGGMGVVLEARGDDGARVALKLLLEAATPSERAAKRFAREAEALAALDHGNIVRLVAASPAGETPPWLAMEFVEGRDLEQLLGTGEVDAARAATAVEQVARGIAHAHRRGVVHRDLKPANILVRSEDGRALVTDFGLARGEAWEQLTRTGTMVGTIPYMAPEQVRGQKVVGPAADVWALGAILYRCLTGRAPFVAESPMALAAAISKEPVEPPSRLEPRVPPDLEATCLACLRKDPQERPTAMAVAVALRDRRGLARRGGSRAVALGVAVAAVSLALAGAAVLTGGAEPPAPAPAPAAVERAGSPAQRTEPSPPPAAEPPWPAPDEGAALAWSLDAGPPARLAPRSAWLEPGRVVAPLAAEAGELGDLFLGTVTALDGGRLRVDYADLRRAGRIEATSPAAVHLGPAGAAAGVLEDDPTSARAYRLRAPNDTSGLLLWVGRAAWLRPRLTVDLRRVAAEDADIVEALVGAGHGLQRAALVFSGRKLRVSVGPGQARYALAEEWTPVAFAPGAPSGERVRVGDLDTTALDAAADRVPEAGGVAFSLTEANLGLRRVVVEGEPLRTDAPALAWAPAGATGAARVSAAFLLARESARGGPVLALGRDESARLEATLEGELRLTHADRLIAHRELPRDALEQGGWLALEAAGPLLRGELHTPRGDWRVEGADPWRAAPPGPLEAGYGSSGPRVTFGPVEVWSLAPRTPAGDLARWRAGAEVLRTVADPTAVPEALRGGSALGERTAEARRAAGLLAEAGGRADGAVQADALARAALAWALAGDPSEAAAAAERLVAAVGQGPGAARVDALATWEGRPSLLDLLVRGLAPPAALRIRMAGMEAALVLVPERRPSTLVGIAGNIRLSRPRADTPEGRGALELALTKFAEAAAAGAPPGEVEGPWADTLMDLGRYAEALAHWERVRHVDYWWNFRRRGDCLRALGRAAEATVAFLGALRLAPGRPDVHQALGQLIQQAQAQGQRGLAAAALVALGRLLDEQTRSQVLPRARALASKAADAATADGDLARYALACTGGAPGAAASERPEATLAAARGGDPEARERLGAAARRAEVVLHLAHLDPELRSLLDR